MSIVFSIKEKKENRYFFFQKKILRNLSKANEVVTKTEKCSFDVNIDLIDNMEYKADRAV